VKRRPVRIGPHSAGKILGSGDNRIARFAGGREITVSPTEEPTR
jgi:hypothetical protein